MLGADWSAEARMIQHSLLIEKGVSFLLLTFQQVGKGGTENWQRHLSAIPDIYPFIRYNKDVDHGILNPYALDKDCGPDLSNAEREAVRLYSGIVVWIDILGSASTGLRPQYSNSACPEALKDTSSLQLHTLMGCRNWVMFLVSRF
jgi:hypothetical protein